jgi:hypothetical protein
MILAKTESFSEVARFFDGSYFPLDAQAARSKQNKGRYFIMLVSKKIRAKISPDFLSIITFFDFELLLSL